MAKRVKYLGSADVAVLEPGEDFNGRLANPLDKEFVWSWAANKHVLDVEAAGMPAAAIDLLLEDTERFVLVEGDLIPIGQHQIMWQGVATPDAAPAVTTGTEANEPAVQTGTPAAPKPNPVKPSQGS